MQLIAYGTQDVYFGNNNPQITFFRVFDRQQNHRLIVDYDIYGDSQNVHDTTIASSIKDSILRLFARTDIPVYDETLLLSYIQNDIHIVNKHILYDYIKNVVSIYGINADSNKIVWYIINVIRLDFDEETQIEIKKILDIELHDSIDKCTVGKISRLVNCLNGFSKDVTVIINDTSQIGNIIINIKNKLGDAYTIEKHKELAKIELSERGYDEDTINTWLDNIE